MMVAGEMLRQLHAENKNKRLENFLEAYRLNIPSFVYRRKEKRGRFCHVLSLKRLLADIYNIVAQY